MKISRKKIQNIAIAAALVIIPLGGCSSGGMQDTADGTEDVTPSASATPQPSVTASDGTVFTGTYASRFARLYQDVNSDLARQILKDGKITDAEWTELQNAYASCIEGYGGKVTFDSTTGQELSITSPADDPRWELTSRTGDGYVSEADMSEYPETVCYTQTDFLQMSSLYDDLGRHPGGYDDAKALQSLVDCLVSHGLADEGLTVEEYKQIVSDEARDAEVFGKYTDESRSDYNEKDAQQYWSCQEDPNH